MGIKISYVLNLLLAAVLVFLSIRIAFDHPRSEEGSATSEQADASSGATETALNNIMTRTSVRDYTDEAINDYDLETMLKAAMAAPTAGNKQPWRFVVIKERATLDSIASHFNSMRMAAKAPLAIVVCGDTKATFEGEGVGYWIQDASAATENLLLAAHALGLGAVWCGVTPLTDRMEYVSQLLGLPADILPLNVVVIGHPAETPTPKDKWKPENIQYEKWK